MAHIKFILGKLHSLSMRDSKIIQEALQKHLSELEEREDIAAYDRAKARKEKTESLETVLVRLQKDKRA